MRPPNLICHCDWSKTAKKRWIAKAVLGIDGNYTVYAPECVDAASALLPRLRAESGDQGRVLLGFDFPIGIPLNYAERAGATSFRDFLLQLGVNDWREFFHVCNSPDQISVYRPFYPNRCDAGVLRQQLFDGHGVRSMEPLLRLCERGGNGQRQACSLFWTLGGNQVGKAALCGWKDVLIPAMTDDSVGLWPFDGTIESLLQDKRVVIAETYPAECYGWFPDKLLRSKSDIDSRREYGSALLKWAERDNVVVEQTLMNAIRQGFPVGKDDAFDAVVGLFGMIQICTGKRSMEEPTSKDVQKIEGWILGRRSSPTMFSY